MLWLWILIGIFAFLGILCLLRVGVLIAFGAQTTVDVRIGPFSIRLFPEKVEEKDKPEEKKSEKKEKKKKPASSSDKKLEKPTWADIQSAYHALWPPIRKALTHVRKGIRISPMTVSLVLAGKENPAGAAQQCGYVHAAVWTLMPGLEQLLAIDNPSIHIGVDFEHSKTALDGQVGVSIRVGTLLLVGVQTAVPIIKWAITYRKQKQQASDLKPAQAPEEKADAAA